MLTPPNPQRTLPRHQIMDVTQPNNPLHGKTLKVILEALVEHLGWEELGDQIDIRCFNYDPSISSSLKFLRRTPWARTRVEELYLDTFWQTLTPRDTQTP